MLLQDMYDNYWSQGHGTTDLDIGRTNSASIKLIGSMRKTHEQMVNMILTRAKTK